jgi:Tat protein secretion system quality control protein TatD with DNase activity
MINCHAHLAAQGCDVDRYAVRRRATEIGMRGVLVVGEDVEDKALAPGI